MKLDYFQNELTTLQAIRVAVGNGLSMLSECYEKVSLDLDNDDDSDDDGGAEQKSIVYRSKNPHEDIPLPHLIGSRAWNEKWHIGLYNSDDDLSQDGDAGDGDDYSPSSDAESVSLSVSTTSIVPTVTDSDYSGQASRSSQQTQPEQIAILQPMSVANDFITRDPGIHTPATSAHRQKAINLFDDSESETEEQLRETNKPHTKDLPTSEPPRESSIFRTQKPAQSVTVAANLFDDEPPEIDFPVKNDRKPVNLFVETDDEDDEMFQPQKLVSKQVPSAVPVAAPRKNQSKSVNIFDDGIEDDDDDDFLKPKVMPSTKKSDISNLFDDSPPSDLFDVLIQKQPKVAVTGKTKLQKGLFDDFESDNDDFAIAPASKITLPEKDVSSTKTAKRTSIFDEFDDDNDDFEKLIASTNKSKPFEFEAAKTVTSVPQVPVKRSIFDDFDDDNEGFIASNEPNQSLLVRKDLDPLQPTTTTTKIITNEATTDINVSNGQFLENFFDDQVPDDDYDEIFEKSIVQSKSKSNELFDNDIIPPIDKLSQLTSARSLAEISDNIDSNILSEATLSSSKSRDNDTVESSNSNNSSRASVENPQLEEKNNEDHVNKSTKIVIEVAQNEPDNIKATIVNTASSSNVLSFLDNDPPSNENDLFTNSSLYKKSENTASSSTPTALFFEDIPPDDHQVKRITKSEFSAVKEFLTETRSVDIKVAEIKPKLSATLGLFDDLPPDDDFLFVSESTNIEKSSQSIGLFDDLPSDDDYMSPATSTSKLANNQQNTAANVSLFNDLPPDDDIFGTNKSPTISTTNVYYDDFADTIVKDDIFTEKPPIDIHTEPANDIDQLDRAVAFIDKLSKFSQQSESWKKIEEVPVSNTLPKPKKLNEKFNINVAALLPGAKRPSFKAPSTDAENEVMTSPTAANSTADTSSRLVGLNKSRAKIQVQRRPSTRKARQNEYRKSIIDIDTDDESLISNSKKDSNTPKVSATASTPTNTVIQASIEDMFKNATPDDWLVPPAIQPQTPPMIDEEPHKSGHKAINKDSDWLFCAPKQVPHPRIESIDGKEENSFTEKLSDKKNVSLFDDESEEDDWLAKSTTSAPRLSPVKIKQNVPIAKSVSVVGVKQPQKQASLFSDDEDEDDLFAPLTKHVASETPTLSSIKVPSVTSLNVSGNGGGDNIAASTLPSKHNVPLAASSLFDDDDDDDDLFGGTSKQSVGQSKPHENVLPIKATAQLQSKAGLFGDSDEDDDDIFSSSKSKGMCKI